MLVCFTWNMGAARAQDDAVAPSKEYWTGAYVSDDVWSFYGGATLAPWSGDIHKNGLLLRAVTGYGQYSYDKPFTLGPERNQVQLSFTEAMAGYQMTFGPLTAKAFAGLASIDHRLLFKDPDNELSGFEYGPKGALELWLNVGSWGWTSLDASYTTAHHTITSRWRGGYLFTQKLSFGPEVAYDNNVEGDSIRGGAFGRYQWVRGEFSVSAGGISDAVSVDPEGGWKAYGTANLLFKF